MEKEIHVFATPDAVAKMACDFIVVLAAEKILEHGRFVIALSGGTTPNAMYELLASTDYSSKIEWDKVHVLWSDERCVALDSPENNAHTASMLLLNKVAIPAENIHRIPVDLEPHLAAIAYERDIKELYGEEQPHIDLVLLGMGEDGHTASIFPGGPVVQEQYHLVKEVYVPKLNMYRITFSPVIINNAHNVLFLITGAAKATVLNTVINDETHVAQYPAQLIRPLTGRLLWFLDTEAATSLRK